MVPSWRDVGLSLAMAAMSAFVFTLPGVLPKVIGAIGVVFFGSGAVVLFLGRIGRPVFDQSRPASQPSSFEFVGPQTPIEVSEEDEARVAELVAVFQSFGVLEGLDSRSVCEGAVDSANHREPQQAIRADDVLAGVAEAPYFHPDADLSAVGRTMVRLYIESGQTVEDFESDMRELAAMGPEPLSFVRKPAVDSELFRATVNNREVVVANGDAGPSGIVTAHVSAVAQLHAERWPGFVLAAMAVDLDLFVLRLPEGSIDNLNEQLGLAPDDYARIGPIGFPSDPVMGSATIGPLP